MVRVADPHGTIAACRIRARDGMQGKADGKVIVLHDDRNAEAVDIARGQGVGIGLLHIDLVEQAARRHVGIAHARGIVVRLVRQIACNDALGKRPGNAVLCGAAGDVRVHARAADIQPEVLLMDEPTSALDPISTSKIEDLAVELKKDYTIIMVTHNMQQAARISDKTAFFLLGEVVEYGETEQIFSMPKDKRTEDYITGRFG